MMGACASDHGIVQLLCADGACKLSLTADALAAHADLTASRRRVEEAAFVSIDQVFMQQNSRSSTPL